MKNDKRNRQHISLVYPVFSFLSLSFSLSFSVMSTPTYRDYNSTNLEGVPTKPKGDGSGFWSFLHRKPMHNLIDSTTEKNETARRTEEFHHETEPFMVLYQSITLALHTFFTALVYILSTTMQPLLWTAPITATEFWINWFGKTLVFLILIAFVQFVSACPGYRSILSCIRTPFITFCYAPKDDRWAFFVKSFFVNLWFIGVIFGCWCGADTAGAYWNQGVWTNIGYPPENLHSGFYDAWYGNFTWIMLIYGASEIVDITVQHRKWYKGANHERASKIWFWPTSPYSLYYDSSALFWTVLVMTGRFYILNLLFGSFLDLGLLFTAPIFDSGNRTALGSYIGAVFAGEGVAWIYLWFIDSFPITGKQYHEKPFLPHKQPDETNEGVEITSAHGKGNPTAHHHQQTRGPVIDVLRRTK